MTKLILDTASTGRYSPPVLDGFEQEAGEWRLELGEYQRLIEDVTGVAVASDSSPRAIKTVQSRLEGCISTYQRSGECACDNLEEYESVDSIETVQELARFFRVLAATRIEDSPPADSPGTSAR
jgi:hypothetical protein